MMFNLTCHCLVKKLYSDDAFERCLNLDASTTPKKKIKNFLKL